MSRVNNDAVFWDRIARKYAADPIADMPGYERTLERTLHYLGSNDAVYEFGCGTGTTALRLAPSVRRLVATDISPGMISIAREKAEAEGCRNVEFEVGKPDAAPHEDGAFDAVLGFNVLHLIAEREAALRGVHRLLKPGGLFISKTRCMSEMNPLLRLAVPAARLFGQAPYVAFFNARQFEGKIETAGFSILACERHGSNPRKDYSVFLVARKL